MSNEKGNMKKLKGKAETKLDLIMKVRKEESYCKAETKIESIINGLHVLHTEYDKALHKPEQFEDDFQHGHALGWLQAMEAVIYRLENEFIKPENQSEIMKNREEFE